MSNNELQTTSSKLLEDIVKECRLSTIANAGAFDRAFRLANGVNQLRKMLTPALMAPVMNLQCTALGFRTDKDRDGGYPENVVKECLIEAVLRGVMPTSNEFNIIAGRTYITKEGFARLVREFPGMSNLRLTIGVPKTRDGGALVTCQASWKLDGKEDSIEREFAVKLNAGMGADGAVGKATRKTLAAVYGVLTGSEHSVSDGDANDNDAIPTTGKVVATDQGQTIDEKLAAKAAEAAKTAAPTGPVERTF